MAKLTGLQRRRPLRSARWLLGLRLATRWHRAWAHRNGASAAASSFRRVSVRTGLHRAFRPVSRQPLTQPFSERPSDVAPAPALAAPVAAAGGANAPVRFRCEVAPSDQSCREPRAPPDGGGDDAECRCGPRPLLRALRRGRRLHDPHLREAVALTPRPLQALAQRDGRPYKAPSEPPGGACRGGSYALDQVPTLPWIGP